MESVGLQSMALAPIGHGLPGQMPVLWTRWFWGQFMDRVRSLRPPGPDEALAASHDSICPVRFCPSYPSTSTTAIDEGCGNENIAMAHRITLSAVPVFGGSEADDASATAASLRNFINTLR